LQACHRSEFALPRIKGEETLGAYEECGSNMQYVKIANANLGAVPLAQLIGLFKDRLFLKRNETEKAFNFIAFEFKQRLGHFIQTETFFKDHGSNGMMRLRPGEGSE